MLDRILYRTRQFWFALTAAPAHDNLEQARLLLTEEQFALFQALPPGEQAHGLEVYRQLQASGETHPDLLRAALLHDIGKGQAPLRVWERIAIVLARAAFPEKVREWGRGPAAGWRRPFVVAEQHPQWGAELAAQTGASPLTVALIRRHQEPFTSQPASMEEQLLGQLQTADDHS
ncbi:MAG: HD domain-containing protein [Anaerolineales bacterium]|jgi:putative nucleotidyltransferase with HDIG domain